MMEIDFRRTIPVRYRAEVVVAGGGIAGVCAALAAARQGRRVILIERHGVTGGNATSGGVAAFCGETSGQGEVFDLIVSALEEWRAIAPYRPYEECEARVFDHEILAFVLQELLLRHNVRLLLHTRVAGVEVRDGRIEYVVADGASGLEAVAGEVFVDATGEAVLARDGGFGTVKGRPGDGAQLPMSLMFFVRHLESGEDAPQRPDGWGKRLVDAAELPMTSIWPAGPRANAVKIKIARGDATDTESLTASEVRARRRMMQVLDYFRRVEGRTWMLDHCSPVIGIREGRRVVGGYTLTVDDLRRGCRFDDAVARGVFYLDGHRPDDDRRTYLLPPDELKVPPYQIPLRCLLVRGAVNLLAAGRCLSADQLALSSARVMTTCAMTGQAAGIAAAWAAGLSGGATAGIDVPALCEEIKQRGAVL